jgi:release factor glutamine methyltransferase
LLVAHSLGLDRLQLFLQLDRPITPVELAKARELLMRRGKHEPVAYITGRREFYGRSFAVGRGVLVPRPETELIVDLARTLHAQSPRTSVLDIGTGSGCLAISLALELSAPRVVAVDISPAALTLARSNAAALAAQVEFLLGDGPEALGAAEPFELLVSNPPYIEPGEAASLAPDVREWEPAEALFTPAGEPDHWLERLNRAAAERLTVDGVALIELGHQQAPRALELALAAGLRARTHRDYGGVERVLELRRA